MTDFTDDNVRKLVIVPLLEKAGFIVEEKAKELCPVDTGVLRASIQHRIDEAKLEAIIGTNVPYAKYVEYMYDIDSPHPGRETGQMPFLRPALFLSEGRIKKMIRERFGGR